MPTMRVKVVGGGGGGGSRTNAGGGGGGAGGVTQDAALDVTSVSGAVTVTVGAGGAGAGSGAGAQGSDGGASSFGALLSASGGGGGGAALGTTGDRSGRTGGSGGGAAGNTGTGGSAGGTPVSGEGSAGGAATTNTTTTGGAGGGGAGAVGGSSGTGTAGAGGAGVSDDISGTPTFYGGGGGGAGFDAAGGSGGGGAGSGAVNGNNGLNGAANTGGGGGGGGRTGAVQGAGGDGGSGVVIVRYVTANFGACTGGTITTVGAETVHTFTAPGTFTLVHLTPPSGGGAFADWLAWPDREEIVLCELEPSVPLHDFVAVGVGAPNTYRAPLPPLVQFVQQFDPAILFPGGLYHDTLSVREDATALTPRASIALVDANPGSWFWDEASVNGMLYVRPTAGAPSTHTMQAVIRLYFANAPIVLERTPGVSTSAVYYHPWLTGDLPHVVRETEDLLSGVTTVPSGSVTFTNGHQAWIALAVVDLDNGWNWKNSKARFFIGGRYNGLELTRDQYAPVATMLVEDIAPTDDVCVIALQPLLRLTEIELPVTPFFEAAYPNLGDGVRGTRKWIGYGRALIEPDLTDISGLGVYTVADAAYQTLFAIHAVWAIHKTDETWTLLAETVDYTVNLVTCVVSIVNPAYAHGDYRMAVDVTGKPDGSGSYLRTYGEVVRDTLETFLGVPTAEIDTAAFAMADLDADAEIALWIKSPRTLASILATAESEFPSLGRSTMGTLQQTAVGQWTCHIWNPTVGGITTTLRREDLARFTPKPKLKAIYSTVNVFYGFDHVRQQWSVVTATDPTIEYRTRSKDSLDIYTYLRDTGPATSLAQRYLQLTGGVTVEADFAERGALLALHNAGDKVKISYSPAPTPDGGYHSTPFGILSIDLRFAPKLTISGRVGNLHNLGGKLGVWMDAAAPDYLAATAEQVSASGFWCDAAGLANPADPSSGGRSLWW